MTTTTKALKTATVPLTQAVRERASTAGGLCSALEAGAGAINTAFGRLFSRFLGAGGLQFDLQPLLTFLVSVLRTLVGQLLDDETIHQTELRRVREARQRRRRAIEPVRKKMKFFRGIDLRVRKPVVPEGPISNQPTTLLDQARVTGRRLHGAKLTLAPGLSAGVRLYPSLRTEFDEVVAELAAASDDLDDRLHRSAVARAARDQAIAELDFYLGVAGQLARALQALPDNWSRRVGKPKQRAVKRLKTKGDGDGQSRS